METAIEEVNRPGVEEQESTESPPAGRPSDKTPQEFYSEITRRADVREILEELAAG